MTLQKFTEQIRLLRVTYGEKAYPDPRVSLLFKALAYRTDEWFTAACEHFISGTVKPPMLPDFLEFKLPRPEVYKAQPLDGPLADPATVREVVAKVIGRIGSVDEPNIQAERSRQIQIAKDLARGEKP